MATVLPVLANHCAVGGDCGVVGTVGLGVPAVANHSAGMMLARGFRVASHPLCSPRGKVSGCGRWRDQPVMVL